MTGSLEKYIGRNVPRYTSYPTAPHFSGAIGSGAYGRWLNDLDPTDPISLYLHVPFCRELCWYCGCNMKLAKRDAPLAQYAQTLIREINLLADHLPGRFKISHLHWGGGTPTALQPCDLQKVMDAVIARFDFESKAELAIESDPRTVTDAMIEKIGDLGFTRASFGVQEFDPKVQRAINRIQPPEMVERCVTKLRNAGVSGINFDLIYGLPHQTVEKLLETIRICGEMAPDRIALFGYAHVPWMAKKQRLIDESALPGATERLDQAQKASVALGNAGYIAIGLDHFARPEDPLAKAYHGKKMRRNFQGYTTDRAETMLGVGTTSIGRTPSGFVQNIGETGAWTRSIDEGVLPIGKGLEFVGDDRLRGYVIERLMCDGEVDLNMAAARFGVSNGWYLDHIPDLEDLQSNGLILRNGGHLALTKQGLPLVRVVAAVFDAYLAAGAAKHAVAV